MFRWLESWKDRGLKRKSKDKFFSLFLFLKEAKKGKTKRSEAKKNFWQPRYWCFVQIQFALSWPRHIHLSCWLCLCMCARLCLCLLIGPTMSPYTSDQLSDRSHVYDSSDPPWNQTLPKAQRTQGLSSAYQSNYFHITSSYTNLDQSSSESQPSTNFKVSTKYQHFDKM